jgi:hypothetical protein
LAAERPLLLVESLTKHAQCGADTFLLGRVVVIGNKELQDNAATLLGPISANAEHELVRGLRVNLERAIYCTGSDWLRSDSSGAPLSGSGSIEREPAHPEAPSVRRLQPANVTPIAAIRPNNRTEDSDEEFLNYADAVLEDSASNISVSSQEDDEGFAG